MKKIILGISGKRGCGKTTLANILHDKYNWRVFPFAGLLKEKCQDDFNLTVEHTDGKYKESLLEDYQKTPREIMISMGQWYRSIDKLFWVKKTLNAIEYESKFVTKFVIPDVRFVNEASLLRVSGAFLIRLERYQHLNIYKEPLNDISETDLDRYPDFDYIIPENRNVDIKDLEYWAEIIDKGIENEIKSDIAFNL